MTTYNYGDPSYDYPQVVIDNRTDGAYEILVGDDAEMLPIVDAFCQGYAEAILWANAYHYVPCDEHTIVAPNTEPGVGMMLEPDDYAQYAYQSPGRWWEGMGIDFTDAVDFLATNLADLWELAGSQDAQTFWEQHGHDFALTRNGHGAGFWDRGYGDVGDRLTDAARDYGEHSVLTDDGPTVTTL